MTDAESTAVTRECPRAEASTAFIRYAVRAEVLVIGDLVSPAVRSPHGAGDAAPRTGLLPGPASRLGPAALPARGWVRFDAGPLAASPVGADGEESRPVPPASTAARSEPAGGEARFWADQGL